MFNKSRLLLLYMCNPNKIIKNIDMPSCKNCVYYDPPILNTFTSPYSKCNKFGEKNIITDEITYSYVDICRNDENRCGKEGKYFEKERYIKIKIIYHKIINSLPYIIPIAFIIVSKLLPK